MKEPKFEIKPPEQKPAAEGEPRQGREEKEPFDRAQDKPETPLASPEPSAERGPEIETWEGEGGATEGPEEEPQEVFDKIE